MIGRHTTRSPRPEVLEGQTTALETGNGRVHVTLNYYDHKPWEVFIHFGRAGSEERALTEAIGRLVSTSLQLGTPLIELADQLRGISSEATYGFGPNKVLSIADAVGRVLAGHATEEKKDGDADPTGVDLLGSDGDQGVGRALQVDGSRLRAS